MRRYILREKTIKGVLNISKCIIIYKNIYKWWSWICMTTKQYTMRMSFSHSRLHRDSCPRPRSHPHSHPWYLLEIKYSTHLVLIHGYVYSSHPLKIVVFFITMNLINWICIILFIFITYKAYKTVESPIQKYGYRTNYWIK